jgi:hypothetical protein
MFILPAGNDVWLNLAAIIASWIVLSFTVVMLWVLIIEVNLFVKAILQDRAADRETKKMFQEIEEIRNDFS